MLLPVAPLCWAGNTVLARGAAELIPPVSFAFFRWTAAFFLLLPFTWHLVRKDWRQVASHWKIMVLISILGISSFNSLLYTAAHTTTAINLALIQTAMPAIIILISMRLYHETVRNLQIAGVLLCVSGACLVVLRGQLQTLLQLAVAPGDLIMLFAVFLYALYSALLRKRPPIHPLSFLTYSFGIGIIGLLPVYLWERAVVGTPQFSREVLFSILYVAVFPSIIAYFCWNRGVELIGANRAGPFINLIPVFASVFAVIWLDETLQFYHLVGLMLIGGGIFLFNR
ncbi:MAG TPA: DMT family transporter, partial [Desulfobacterales bacterium]